ncbi:MAG: phosphoenolpyruvate--protein phosphotransferase [Oscillospiraceae bacterium]|nr:phosphoenolpyruvate--protein phosphotransferase [Oscillospiraceae bacterium]
MSMKILEGIVGSTGFGSGMAVVKRETALEPEKFTITDTAAEVARFRAAQADCEAHLDKLIAESEGVSEDAVEIFGAHKTILQDEAFFKKALDRTEAEKTNIEYLIHDECQAVVAMFAALDDPYLQERAADIEQVCGALIKALLGLEQDFKAGGADGDDVIIVAHDLTPAETVQMDKSTLRGFITEKGGATSHTVILAKALGIPAITGVVGVVDAVADGDFLLMDAFAGTVTVCPNETQKAAFLAGEARHREKQKLYAEGLGSPAISIDGHHVDVNVNTGDAESIAGFDVTRCDGIGLLRTEFLYMGRDNYPDEEYQYEVYADLARRAEGKEVIIRTLDIGGDKQLGYMDMPVEDNPFLGYRAIRLCLDRRDVFQVQLRAILRASAHGNVKIMFPMIINLEELRAAKECVEEAKLSLKQDGLPFNKDIPVGIMIETPAAALLSDRLARESDFFSVGSNDLIQYITATDRMNERIQHLYDSYNLSVLNAIRMVSESAHAAGIPWGICGEVGSEDRLIPLWVALGVAELSVAPSMVGRVKYLVRRTNRAELAAKMKDVLALETADEARAALTQILEQVEA